MNGRVYLVTNTVNGKQYVGQTITKYSKQGHGHAVKAAYKKYGRKAFTYETVCGNINNAATLDFCEKFWIKVFGTTQPNGYNLEEGGRRYKTVHHRPNLGKKASLETRAKMSASQKEYWSTVAVHPSKGRKASEETKQKMSQARLGRKQSNEEKQMRSEAIKKWHQKRKEQLCRTEQ
jgi:group I intron endonuclease